MTDFEIVTFVAFGLAQLADIFTTKAGLSSGRAKEGNPFIAQIMGIFGGAWPFVKAALAGLLAYALWKNGVTWAIWIGTAITAYVAMRNLRYKP